MPLQSFWLKIWPCPLQWSKPRVKMQLFFQRLPVPDYPKTNVAFAVIKDLQIFKGYGLRLGPATKFLPRTIPPLPLVWSSLTASFLNSAVCSFCLPAIVIPFTISIHYPRLGILHVIGATSLHKIELEIPGHLSPAFRR